MSREHSVQIQPRKDKDNPGVKAMAAGFFSCTHFIFHWKYFYTVCYRDNLTFCDNSTLGTFTYMFCGHLKLIMLTTLKSIKPTLYLSQ